MSCVTNAISQRIRTPHSPLRQHARSGLHRDHPHVHHGPDIHRTLPRIPFPLVSIRREIHSRIHRVINNFIHNQRGMWTVKTALSTTRGKMGTEARRFAFNYPRKYPHQCPQYPQNPERAKKIHLSVEQDFRKNLPEAQCRPSPVLPATPTADWPRRSDPSRRFARPTGDTSRPPRSSPRYPYTERGAESAIESRPRRNASPKIPSGRCWRKPLPPKPTRSPPFS